MQLALPVHLALVDDQSNEVPVSTTIPPLLINARAGLAAAIDRGETRQRRALFAILRIRLLKCAAHPDKLD